jgi:hypothetical protein
MRLFFGLTFLLLACGGKAVIDGAGTGGGGGAGAQGGMRSVTVTVGDGGAGAGCGDCAAFCATVDCATPVCCLTVSGQCGCVADQSQCAQCL